MPFIKPSYNSRAKEYQKKVFDVNKGAILNKDYIEERSLPKGYGGKSQWDFVDCGMGIWMDGTPNDREYKVITTKASEAIEANKKRFNHIMSVGQALVQLGDEEVFSILSDSDGGQDVIKHLFRYKEVGKEVEESIAEEFSNVIYPFVGLKKGSSGVIQLCKYLHSFNAIPSVLMATESGIDLNMGYYKIGLLGVSKRYHVAQENPKVKERGGAPVQELMERQEKLSGLTRALTVKAGGEGVLSGEV
jgi:hypothetical protein